MNFINFKNSTNSLRLCVSAVKFLFFISYILLLISIFSCKKNKDTIHINGTVYDPNQKINVHLARVILQSASVQAGVFSGTYENIASANTDASGHFSFNIGVDRVLGYKMIINKDKYFYSETDISPTAWSGGNTYNPVYSIYPQAYLKLDIQNVKPFDEGDVIYYSEINNFICIGCCSDTLREGTGMNFKALSKCITQGGTTTKVSWNFTKNTIDIARDTNVYCIPFDTTSLKIHY